MRKATSVIVGVTSAVAIGASWAAGLTPPKHVPLSGVHLVAAAPPSTSGTPSAGSSGAAAVAPHPTKSSPRTSAGGLTPTRKPTPVSGSVVGGAADTPFGFVQVKVSYTGTTITNVRAVHLTDSSQHSVAISDQAAPTLRQEALAAQSAQIDVVSGATYTSEGYIQSLQSAIDAAHLG